MNTRVIAVSIGMVGLAFLGCNFGLQPARSATPAVIATSTLPSTSTPIPASPTPIPPDIRGQVSVTGTDYSVANRYFVLCEIQDSGCKFTSLVATSNSEGYFEFQDVPAGEYYIFYDSGYENFADGVKKWADQTILIGDVQWLIDNYVTHNAEGGISFTLVEDTVLGQNLAYMMVYRFFATSPFLWAHSCAAEGCSRPENVRPIVASVSSREPAQVDFVVYGPLGELSGEAPAPAAASAAAVVPARGDSAGTIFSDDFEDGSFDGSFDSSLWSLIPGTSYTTMEQEDGVMHIKKILPADTEVGVLKSARVWKISEFSYVEARLKLDEEYVGELANIAFGFEAQEPLVGEAVWWADCGLSPNSPQPYFWCGQESDGEGDLDYYHGPVFVEYGQWYTARIEFDSRTAELAFYLDGEKVDDWQPANADQLLNNKFYVVISSWNLDGTTIDGYVDDYRLVK